MITDKDLDELVDAYRDGYRDGFNKAMDIMREQLISLALEFDKQTDILSNMEYFAQKLYKEKMEKQ